MTEFVHAAGHRLEARWIGDRSQGEPTLVFLHEGLGSVSAWRDFPDRVASSTDLPAFVYSRTGYGASDPITPPRPVRFMHDEAYDVLPAVLDAAGIRQVVLVGHSDGASIALLFASRFASRVRAVVAMAPHVLVEDVCVESITKIADVYRTTDLRERLRKHHGDNVDGAFWGWNRVWLDPEFRKWNIETEVASVVCPVLVLQGDADEYGTLVHARSIEKNARGTVEVQVLAKCGHSPHRDAADQSLAAIGTFVREIL